ncbi:hypothetical protein Deipe_3601 [Deinococcus peraridilitoris DSM 19664]|uniref:YdhG-like domain-containing protein n=1 Tax=Deinococcus peraridilitoris (strain DSM 19664 / LMG 22246 / CIP 109416 / KR-200) TaxID=937777 RepID=L0A6F5_DEIPD|nr:hypothetical protein Deipe_3601 [Deinococcus peraridilitoris DSM 19664]
MTEDLSEVFERLRDVLEDETEELNVIHDEATKYEVRAGRVFFGSVVLRRTQVVFQLRALETRPELGEELPEPLRRRLQGKAEFVFKTLDDVQAHGLAELTRRAFDAYAREGEEVLRLAPGRSDTTPRPRKPRR